MSKILREDGSTANNSKAILHEVRNYYENLFSEVEGNCSSQDELLKVIDAVIGKEENSSLTEEVDEMEVRSAIFSMKNGKTPGLDGLSVEFYKEMWHIIKAEFLQVVKYILQCDVKVLLKNINSGVITLIPKGSDLSDIINWRPITMLNVDYKIFAKIITNRIKPLLSKIISPEQFCGVEGRSINKCNVLLRDIMFYSNEQCIPAAFVNLDWAKAFDRVNLKLLFKIMLKLGFDEKFIGWVKMLYNKAESCLCINGHISEPFSISKSVRQGCPLSMILYIIYQEPLYKMMKVKLEMYSPVLPNRLQVVICGYADDSTVIVNQEEGLIKCFEVIKTYEDASGAKLNWEKTSILGVGRWKAKSVWPIAGLKVLQDNCKILGIYHDNDYQRSILLNWESMETSISRCVGMFYNRKLTLFQKTILINSKVLAKTWYLSHVYPIHSECGKRIQRCLFKYLWNGSYEPINRRTMYLPKYKGGCGILDVLCKSRAILFNTFLKAVLDKDCLTFRLIVYYCQIRATYLIDYNGYKEASLYVPPYYNTLIDSLRIIVKLKQYPLVNAKDIYWALMERNRTQPKAELNYPLFNWKEIWTNVFNKYIEINSRVVLFKFIHEILATKERLHMLKISDEYRCINCGETENNMHLFYFCPLSKNLISWFKDFFFRMCNVKTNNFIKILKLDFKPFTLKDRNTANVLISDYVAGVWYGCKVGLTVDDPRLASFIKNRMIKNKWILCKMYPRSVSCMFNKKYLEMS